MAEAAEVGAEVVFVPFVQVDSQVSTLQRVRSREGGREAVVQRGGGRRRESMAERSRPHSQHSLDKTFETGDWV